MAMRRNKPHGAQHPHRSRQTLRDSKQKRRVEDQNSPRRRRKSR